MSGKNECEYERSMFGYDIYFDRDNDKYIAVVKGEEPIPLYTHFSGYSLGEVEASLEIAKENDDI